MRENNLFSKGYFKNLELLKMSLLCNFVMTVFLILSAAGVIYVSSRRQNVPYIVEIDKDTKEIMNTKVLDSGYKNNSLQEKQIEFFLTKIIVAVRSIPTDKKFYQENINAVQVFFTRESGTQLKESLSKNQVAEKLTNQISVTVEINSIVKMEKNKNRYQVIWTEQISKTFNDIPEKKKYTAIIDTGVIPVKTKKMMSENPFGFVIKDIVISEMN